MVSDKDNIIVDGLPDNMCREAWEVLSDGLSLFDTNGHGRVFNAKDTELAVNPVADSAIEAAFVGCRPKELLDAANPTADRFCELTESGRLPHGLRAVARWVAGSHSRRAGPVGGGPN